MCHISMYSYTVFVIQFLQQSAVGVVENQI